MFVCAFLARVALVPRLLWLFSGHPIGISVWGAARRRGGRFYIWRRFCMDFIRFGEGERAMMQKRARELTGLTG
jgi:hypothetical protein